MLYQITNKAGKNIRLNVLIVAPDSKGVGYDRRDISFIYDVARRCNLLEFSVQLMHMYSFEMGMSKYEGDSWIILGWRNFLQDLIYTAEKKPEKNWQDYYDEEVSGQRFLDLDYESESDFIKKEYEKLGEEDKERYEQKMRECQSRINANQKVVLVIYGHINEMEMETVGEDQRVSIGNSAIYVMLRGLKEIGYNEDVNVQIIINDDKVKSGEPSWVEDKLGELIGGAEKQWEDKYGSCLCPHKKAPKDCKTCKWYVEKNDQGDKSCPSKYGRLFYNAFFNTTILKEESVEITPEYQSVNKSIEERKKEINKSRLEIQDELDKLRRDLCMALNMSTSNHKKTSEEIAHNECNLSVNPWKDVFNIKANSPKDTVYMVATGMRMNMEQFERIMKLNGYINRPTSMLKDAIVELFIRYFAIYDKAAYNIDGLNTLLANYGEKPFKKRTNNKKDNAK